MIGTRLLHYRVEAKLGQGGMGEVYRATDTKLGREVAIKVLPASISRDAQSLARFEREARALAALNHPHIAAIHGFDADQETHFIVLELVAGETLAGRLRRGPLPLDEALRVARQIAEAVEAAHAKGVIHRDLKPGNVKFTADGRVKVLDFGLAKLSLPSPGLRPPSPHPMGRGQGEGQTADPDAPTQLQSSPPAETTTPGAVLGTPAYMSPEQARGQEVDKRTDVWAFGCCLFECLAGSKPFTGGTVTDMMAAVLRSEPDWTALPAETPREVVTLLRRCLEKEPRRRLSSLGDIAILLEDTTQTRLATPVASTRPARQPARERSILVRLGYALAGLALGLAVAGIVFWRQPRPAERAGQIRSLAVLPFEVSTSDPKLAGLGKWIPAEILSKLGQVTNLQVVNTPARIDRLVQEKKPEVEIARELGVDGLVRGELHGQGEAMKAYVSVVDGATGRLVGGQREIAASSSTISEVPNTVALAIIDELLRLQLSAAQRSGLQEPDTKNSEAFLAFQRGRDLLSSRQFEPAAVELRRAHQLDPNYTRAWANLARSEYVPLYFGGTTNELAVVFRRLSGEVERLGTRRPDDSSLVSLRVCFAMVWDRDWDRARTVFWNRQRNSKPDPDTLEAGMWYYTFVEGHPEQALQMAEQGIALEPENLVHQTSKAYMLSYFGRQDEAMRVLGTLAPDKIQLEDFSRVLLMAGDLAAAKEVATRVRAGRPNAWTQCGLAAIHAKSGAPEEARGILRELEAQAEQGKHIPYALIAWSYGLLGDFEAARRWLRKGLREGRGDWSMLTLRCFPALGVFGRLPWFWEIIDEMNLPPLQMDHPSFALEQALRYRRGTLDVSGGPASSTSTNDTRQTLAVLPFRNIGADKENEYFSDGITEEILNALARTPGLRVAARTSAFAFKDRNESAQRIGEALKVGAVLEGSVRRAGDQLRITAQLVSVADGFTLWVGTFDRRAADVFAIQSEVARQVQEAMKVTLLASTNSSASIAGTHNLEAYDLFLRGRHAWNKRSGKDIERAIGYFEQATQKDSTYALGYAGLGAAYAVLGVWTDVALGETLAKARKAAQRAIELDPQLAEAHAVLAECLHKEGNYEASEQGFLAAIALNPNLGSAHQWYGELLAESGKIPEALAEIRQAQTLDPLSPLYQAVAGRVAMFGRDYPQALAEVDRALEQAPDYPLAVLVRGSIRMVQNKFPEAVLDMERMRGLRVCHDLIPAFQLGYCYGASGRTNEALQIVRQTENREEFAPSVGVCIGLVYLGLGDKDRVFAWLDRQARNPALGLQRLRYNPFWDDVTSDPRYAVLLKKHGFVP
jgi:serine/threonine protein kinase/tetratricopeptide (TPR) repeat protein